MKKNPLIGGHVSTEGGVWNAFQNASRIGAKTIQIFGASPRQYSARIPTDEVVDKFRSAWTDSQVVSVFLHAAYLVNLASQDDAIYEKSIKSLSDHLTIAEKLGVQGLIFHVGSGKEAPKDIALKRATEAMSVVLNNVSGKAQLIIENSAGGGQKIGSSIREIGEMVKSVKSDRVKVCIDTAHAFEAGIIESYNDHNLKIFFDECSQEIGIDNIVAFHINDSKTPFNSRHDRHENIGEGHIGLEGFKAFAREDRTHNAAWILEVPGFENNGPDAKNIEILHSCLG